MADNQLIPLSQAVEAIKTAILQGQYEANKDVNRIQLAVYFAIGKYLSKNTRNLEYGAGAIKAISEKLYKDLPGLRGYSETSLKKMRLFYEAWSMLDADSPITIGKSEKQSAIATAESHPQESCVATHKLQIAQNHEYVIQDYNRPMGVATYKTSAEMDDKLKELLPPIEELKKLL